MKTFAKRQFFARFLFLLFIVVYVFSTFTLYLGTSTAKAASIQKRNVYMFCSKSYFDLVYSDIEKDKLVSPFAFPFYVSKEYSDFFISGFENNKLVFYYTNSSKFTGFNNIKIGTTAEKVKKLKLSFIDKFVINRGLSTYTFTDANLKKEYDVTVVKNLYYVFIFYDRIANPNVVCGIFMVKKSLWDEFLLVDHPLSSNKNSLQNILSSFEKLMLLHLNSMRVYLQKPCFSFSDIVTKIARSHSQNMAKYNFFSHTDNFGRTPSDRFTSAGILYRRLGENIAMGTKLLPFFANHLLLNSKGHRLNIEEAFEVVGAGCAIDEKYENLYYTQNFAVLKN